MVEGKSRPRGFTVTKDQPVNHIEAVGRPGVLHLCVRRGAGVAPETATAEDVRLRAWRNDNTAAMETMRNVVAVRVPDPHVQKDHPSVLKAKWDLTEAWALLGTGQFHKLAIGSELQRVAKLKAHRETLGKMLDELATTTHGQPPYFDEELARQAMKARTRRLPRMKRQLRVVSLLCGVGGCMNAVDAAGVPRKNQVMRDICPEAVEQLRRRFPGADILVRDVATPKFRDEMRELRGTVDVVIVAIPCQGASLANQDRREDDPRLELGPLGASLACELWAPLVIMEDVVSYPDTQPKVYGKVQEILRGHYKRVVDIKLDALKCGTCTRRKRLFIVATNEVDVDTTVGAVSAQMGIPDGETGLTPREVLKQYRGLRGKDSIWLPALRHAKKGRDGRRQRARSIDKFLPCMTTKYNDGNDELRRTKLCDADSTKCKDAIIVPTGAEKGVMVGFSSGAPWSTARFCDCGGCRAPEGAVTKRRAPPGDMERGNVICPLAFMFLMKTLLWATAEVERSSGTPRKTVASEAKDGAAMAHNAGRRKLAVKFGAEVQNSREGGTNGKGQRPRRPAALRQEGGTAKLASTRAVGALKSVAAHAAAAAAAAAGAVAAKAKAWASHDTMGHWMTLDELMSGARPGRSAKSRRRYEEHKQNLQAAGQTVAGTIARHLEGMWGQDGMALVLDPFPHQVAATHRVLWLRDSCVAPTAWSPQDTLETARAGLRARGIAGRMVLSVGGGPREGVRELRHVHVYTPLEEAQHPPKAEAAAMRPEADETPSTLTGGETQASKLQRFREACAVCDDDENEGGTGFRPWSFVCANPDCGKECDGIEWLARVELLRAEQQNGNENEEDGTENRSAERRQEAATVISDDEVETYLRLWHERLGHPSVRRLKIMYRNGDLPGPDIAPEQFDNVQLWCPTCARTRQRKKPSSKKRKAKKARELDVLQEVAVDIVGPRKMRSLKYWGERGNQGEGGNLYMVVFQDRATEYVFVDFIKSKSEMEKCVARMTKVMETFANSSVSYKGEQIKVRRWVSDRDANLTSNKAVADMLKGRIEHVMTVAGTNNQTGALDSLCRRLLEVGRAVLDASGLTLPFWQFALSHACDLMNTFPTATHRLHHSAHERWCGEAKDPTRMRAFGAEVFPLLEQSKRENQSKLSPVAPGQRGRFRYLGEDRGKGFWSKGMRYIDLLAKPPRLHVARDVELNEDMDVCRELPLPKELYPGSLVDWEEALRKRKAEAKRQPADEAKDEEKAEAEDLEEAAELMRAEEQQTKKARKARGKWRDMPGETRIAFRQANPKSGKSFARYERYKGCTTLQEYWEIGGRADDLRNDSSDKRKGGPHLLLLDEGEEPPEGFKLLGATASGVQLKKARGRPQGDIAVAVKVATTGQQLEFRYRRGDKFEHAIRDLRHRTGQEGTLVRDGKAVDGGEAITPADASRVFSYVKRRSGAGKRRTRTGADEEAGQARPAKRAEGRAPVESRAEERANRAAEEMFCRAARQADGRTVRRYIDRHGNVRYLADDEEEAAVKRYAAAARELSRSRSAARGVMPKGVSGGDELLEYWGAAAEHQDTLADGVAEMWWCAREYAAYRVAATEDPAGPTRQEREEKCRLLQEMGLAALDKHMVHFAGAVNNDLSDVRAADVPTPKTYREAMRGEYAELWREAVAKEIKNLQEHQVFRWVPRPPGAPLVDSTWAFKAKSDENGFVSRLKARLVCRGFRQIHGRDYLDSMAPVAKLTTFRSLLAEAAQCNLAWSALDIRSAYLTADLDIPQYMTAPAGVTPPQPDWVMRLERGLYGTVQGARCFHLKFRRELLEWGFEASMADPCLFIRRVGDGEGGTGHSEVIRVLLFVDDMMIVTSKTEQGRALKAELMEKIEGVYEYSTDDAKDMYIGCQVRSVGKNALFLHQLRYIEDFAIKFGLMDRDKNMLCATTWTTAPSAGEVLKKDCPTGPPTKNELGRKYREMCGALRWIEQCSRPDISAALSECCSVQSNPGKKHMERLMHLARYVCTTREYGILYGGELDEDAPCGPVVAYTDSDWSGDKETSETRGGYVIQMWQGTVSWASFKIKSIAASSCESEYMASFHCVRETKWFRYLMSDMGYGDLSPEHFGRIDNVDYEREKLPDYGAKDEKLTMPTLVCCDNQGTVKVSTNPVLHKRTKHIKLKYHLVRLEVNKRHVRLKYVDTKENVADMMTKTLPKVTHEYLRNKMMKQMKGEQVCDGRGEALLNWSPREPKEYTLYELEPPGLSAEDMLVPDVGATCARGLPDRVARDVEEAARVAKEAVLAATETLAKKGASSEEVAKAAAEAARLAQQKGRLSRWELIYYALLAAETGGARRLGERGGASKHGTRSVPAAAASAVEAVISEIEAQVSELVADEVIALVGKEIAGLLEEGHGCSAELEWDAQERLQRLKQQLRDAIVDSGASCTYVTDGVELWEVRSGRGHVWVANGRREAIAQEGKLGPISGAKKVPSFARTLISVRDLVEQFGTVVFDKEGVHVVSIDKEGDLRECLRARRGSVSTTIGAPTKQRLYSFDIEALADHAQRVGG